MLIRFLCEYFPFTVIGEPPRFIADGEPEDAIVSSDHFRMSSDGLMGNLVLPCTVTGSPQPTITWYRGEMQIEESSVTSTGTLVLNVTEGVEASRMGMIYHCLASNMIGPEGSQYQATLRSRDVTVTYTCK